MPFHVTKIWDKLSVIIDLIKNAVKKAKRTTKITKKDKCFLYFED